MTKNNNQHLVVYDLTCNKERNRVAKLLLGYGFRVQKSVFECRLSKSLRGRLEKDLTRLELQTGTVLIYRIASRTGRREFGKPTEVVHNEMTDYAFIF